jgi:hypothetical protein
LKHPSGYRWKIFCQAVFGTYGDTCVVCRHGGARTIDHVIPLAERPDLMFSLENCRPIHGTRNKCFQCDPVKGLNCNSVKGGMSLERARRIVAERAGASQISRKKPVPQRVRPSEGRPW